MEIKFTVFQNVQVILLKGTLGQTEAAAIRHKLEEKLNKGRAKVLFDLAQFDIDNNTARHLLLNIILYALNRGALVGCGGVASDKWPLLQFQGRRQCKLYLIADEGKSALAREEAPKLDQLGAAEKSVLLGDVDEVKSQALRDLLAKYEVYQKSDEGDPFRLQFYSEQYKQQPSAEVLVIEKNAKETLTETRDMIKILDSQCEALAARTKSALLYRKAPVTERELNLKESELQKAIAEQTKLIEEVQTDLRTFKEKETHFRQATQNERQRLDKEFADLQKKYQDVCTETEKINQHISQLDLQEQVEFEAKREELGFRKG